MILNKIYQREDAGKQGRWNDDGPPERQQSNKKAFSKYQIRWESVNDSMYRSQQYKPSSFQLFEFFVLPSIQDVPNDTLERKMHISRWIE